MKKSPIEKKKTTKEPANNKANDKINDNAKDKAKGSNIHILKLIVFLLCVLIFVSLYSYSSQDPLLTSLFSNQVELDNHIGVIGAFISGWLVYIFGVYAYLIPVLILCLNFGILFKYIINSVRKLAGYTLVIIVLLAFATYYEWQILDIIGGGFLGAQIYQHALKFLNPLGSLILFYSLLPLAIECFFPRIISKTLNIFALIYNKSFGRLIEKSKEKKEQLALTKYKDKDSEKDFDDDFDDSFVYDDVYDDDYDNNFNKYDDFDDTIDKSKKKFIDDYDDDKDKYDDEFDDKDYAYNDFDEEDEFEDKDKKSDMDKNSKDEKQSFLTKTFGFLTKNKESDNKKDNKDSFALPDKENGSYKKRTNTHDPFERPYDDDDYFYEEDEFITDLDEEYIAKPQSTVDSSSTIGRAARTKLYASTKPRKRKAIPKNVHLPTSRLLSSTQDTEIKIDQRELEAKGALLIRVLKNYNIIASLVRITTGPVITMFEVRPAAGIKINKITSLGKELALNLKATSIRFQAPVLGSDTVGIEIPNTDRATVAFKELIDSKDFRDSSSLLTLALGKNISGQPVVYSLAKMPHLLIAGATGMGKSVCLNSIILSILYKAKPHEVKLLLIDPKIVEFGIYDDLPHLVHPVVTKMDEVKYALAWVVNEMERRYRLLSDLGARSLDSYNQIVNDSKEEIAIKKQQLFSKEELDEDLYHERLPYIVVVIDELADLMMEFGKEVETPIARLGQKARAAGIHMILATQRPSVNVVTGIIKANLPTRIALGVVSLTDSRTILDSGGAETLLGKGDMLIKSDGGRIQRLHGAFMPDADVAKIIDFWKKQQGPDYKFDLSEMAEEDSPFGGHDSNNNDKDVLFDKAAAFAPTMKKFSVCGLQRHLNIGFNRASNLRDQLVREGVIHID